MAKMTSMPPIWPSFSANSMSDPATPIDSGKWSLLREMTVFAIATRFGLAAMVWLSLRALPRIGLYPTQLPDSFLPGNPFLDGWARWDSAHYIAVARFGYGDPASPSPDGGIGFFPLYPLLMRAIATVTGQTDSNAGLAVIGIVVSIICFAASLPLLVRLAGDSLPINDARFAVSLFLVFPFAFFYTAAYTEALFVLEVLAAIYFARQKRWWMAALMGLFASATRLVGLSVIGGVLYAAWRGGVRLPRLIALGAIGASGFLGFLAWLWVKVDDPMAYFRTQERWGSWSDHVWFYVELFLTRPREALSGDPRHLIIIGNVALAGLALALVPTMFKRLDPATAGISILLVVGQFLITWVSLGRYLAPAIGIYLAAAIVTSEHRRLHPFRQSILAVSLIAMTSLAILFAHGFWVV